MLEAVQKTQYIVYTEAHTKNPRIRTNLIEFYKIIIDEKIRGGINGLVELRPIISEKTLDGLLSNKPPTFIEAIRKYKFNPSEDLGIWTVWEDSKSIDDFYRNHILHKSFRKFAMTTTESREAWYRIVQLHGDEVIYKEVR